METYRRYKGYVIVRSSMYPNDWNVRDKNNFYLQTFKTRKLATEYITKRVERAKS
jgi:hypothetical protein